MQSRWAIKPLRSWPIARSQGRCYWRLTGLCGSATMQPSNAHHMKLDSPSKTKQKNLCVAEIMIPGPGLRLKHQQGSRIDETAEWDCIVWSSQPWNNTAWSYSFYKLTLHKRLSQCRCIDMECPWMTLGLLRKEKKKGQNNSKRTQQLVLKITFFQWTSLKNYLFLLNLTQKLPFPTEALSKCLDGKQCSFKLKMSQGHEKKLIENFRVPCWYLKQPVGFCSLTQICSAASPLWFLYCQNQRASRLNGFLEKGTEVMWLLLPRFRYQWEIGKQMFSKSPFTPEL